MTLQKDTIFNHRRDGRCKDFEGKKHAWGMLYVYMIHPSPLHPHSSEKGLNLNKYQRDRKQELDEDDELMKS